MHHHIAGKKRKPGLPLGAALGALVVAIAVRADDGRSPADRRGSAWAPKFYGLCIETHDARRRSIAAQAQMLVELGFDGAGYPLWPDGSLEKNLRVLDQAGLDLYQLYTEVNLAPNRRPYDPRLAQAIPKLKGRPVTIAVLLRGLAPADPRGQQLAVRILRRLGDLAAEAGLRISVYHHTGDWTESLLHAIEVVEAAKHPQVGVNFNLCHWLKVNGDKDYRPVLRAHAERIFAVTINGAKLGSTTWTGGLIQPLDRGDFDNRALLRVLRDVGYRGPIGLMCYGIPGDAREHLQRSIDVWNTWHANHSDRNHSD